jgi:hypothetical protein
MSTGSHTSSPAPPGLDWVAFSKRYFPGRPRHDLKGIAVYAAYVRKQAALDADFDDEARRQTQVWAGVGGAHA